MIFRHGLLLYYTYICIRLFFGRTIFPGGFYNNNDHDCDDNSYKQEPKPACCKKDEDIFHAICKSFDAIRESGFDPLTEA